MKKQKLSITTVLFIIIATAIAFSGCNNNGTGNIAQFEIDSLRDQVKQLTANDATLSKNLQTFDTLDYTVFSNQQWDRLRESHAADIKVYWADGHVTEGIDKHIEDLKALFV